MKIKMAKMPKIGGGPKGRRPPLRGGGHAAFGGGGSRAFSDPSTMTAPDQAFSAAMAMPQGGGAAALPDMPAPPATEG
jgi:hypothetical protein